MVTNFAEGFPLRKKILVNVLDFLGDVIIRDRENYLRKKDIKRAKRCLKKGDIVLVGDLRRLSTWFITGPLTHSMMYLGHGKFIHATFHGVCTISAKEVFKEYDAMMILRVPGIKRKQVRRALKYAKKQIGQPYNFDRKPQDQGFYCSELIHCSLTYAGVDFKINKGAVRFSELDFEVDVHPMHYVTCGFNIAFCSRNLEMQGDRVHLKED